MSDIRRISGVEKVRIDELHVRFIPGLTPPWNGMRIVDSPHVELLEIYKDRGNVWKYLKDSAYVKERQIRRQKGMNRWTDKYIRTHHLPKRFAIYESIKKNGFNRKFPIEVLGVPFWESRFGYQGLEGPEIWTGAGRAAAMVVLGKRRIACRWYVDTMPGTANKGKFGKKLAGMDVTFG